ncbi:nucleotidyltransferase family protein [Hyphomicrobium sp.]|uniref:nucleotidyltransferase family protein n=1 Tax=Hyphomicrobium sp. TaxID=82 RepID=UPI002D76C33E|nr:nucleotidyltransferase family protein [Hyphomicrobium sp.]HET6390220.1 nucleotidyltransferase family protein [Hyphomicrobium sp.]
MRVSVLKGARPAPQIDLLLQACLAPPDAARAAWHRWLKNRELDDASWPEMRILAPLSGRLRTLDPDSTYRPRIEGLAKSHWTQTQFMLGETLPAIKALRKAGIECMLIKGAAGYAEGFGPTVRRLMGDVDILVRQEDGPRAAAVLTASGWESTNGDSALLLKQLAPLRASSNYRRGVYGEVDLHTQAFHFCRRDSELESALWRDARSISFGGTDVCVPSSADSMVISLAHGVAGADGDWAIDIGQRINAGGIDWDRTIELVERRALVPLALAGLSYLHELGLGVPQEVLRRLGQTPVAPGVWLKHYASIRPNRRQRRLLQRLADVLSSPLLPRAIYHRPFKSDNLIGVARDNLGLWSPRRWRRIPLAEVHAAPSAGHCIEIDGSADVKVCGVSLRFPASRQSRRVFIEVVSGETVIHRLRGRLRSRTGKHQTMRFEIPLNDLAPGQRIITLEARPSGYVSPAAPQAEVAAKSAPAFQVTDAWAA